VMSVNVSEFRAVAQLVERRSPKPMVGGSNPSCPANAGLVIASSPARARVQATWP
jgi:hypothetical protein